MSVNLPRLTSQDHFSPLNIHKSNIRARMKSVASFDKLIQPIVLNNQIHKLPHSTFLKSYLNGAYTADSSRTSPEKTKSQDTIQFRSSWNQTGRLSINTHPRTFDRPQIPFQEYVKIQTRTSNNSPCIKTRNRISKSLQKVNSEQWIRTKRIIASRLPKPEKITYNRQQTISNIAKDLVSFNRQSTMKLADKEKTDLDIKELDPLAWRRDKPKKFWDDPKIQFRKRVLSWVKHLQQIIKNGFDYFNPMTNKIPTVPFGIKRGSEFIAAIKRGDLDYVKYWIKKNRWIVHVFDLGGQNGLHWCARRNHVNIMHILLQYGCFVDSRDKFGRTPLFIAAQIGNLNILRDLIINRADPYIKSKGGNTPIEVARGHQIHKILERAMLITILQYRWAQGKKEEVWQQEGINFFTNFDENKRAKFSLFY